LRICRDRDDSCGKKISVKTPRDVVENIAHNIERLFKNEPERQRLSKGALQRAKNFMWECKAIELNNIYRLCLKSDRYFLMTA
jgi:glycosyltransferase involved in cell wall biosynthesis